MKAKQFYSKNQIVITDDDGSRYLQSYNSMIAKIDAQGNVTLDEKFWDYSVTTGTYRNRFLGDSGKAVTQGKIDSGEYKLDNLNK